MKKIFTMEKIIQNCEVIPKWYGIAYRDFLNDSAVCYPVPLNWLVRWGCELARRLKIPTATKWEGVIAAAYQKGFAKGREDAAASILADMADRMGKNVDKMVKETFGTEVDGDG